jgi:beta-glucanase (GH16 family)
MFRQSLVVLGVILLAFATTLGAERVFALSGRPVGTSASLAQVTEGPQRACIAHAQYESSFGHGEFQRDGFDRAFWDTHFAWGRANPSGGDGAYYADPNAAASADNIAIADDPQTDEKHILRLRAQSDGHRYVSGMIATWSRWRQRYGYFSARMRLPKGKGLWPAFWMLDANGNQLEWDIEESLNDLAFVNQAEHIYAGKIQYGGKFRQSFDPSIAYHDYGVLLQPGTAGATFYIDGNPVPRNSGLKDITAAHGAGPLGEYMMVTMQVGAQQSWSGPPDATTHWPADLYVENVRAFKLVAGSC